MCLTVPISFIFHTQPLHTFDYIGNNITRIKQIGEEFHMLITLLLPLFFFTVSLIIFVNRKKIIKKLVNSFIKIIISDNYDENLSELIPGFGRTNIQTVIENSLRAESGSVLHRPLGPNKKWPTFDSLVFTPAQTTPFPIDREEKIDIGVTLGPNAKKPLKLKIPLLISGMGYGVGLSEKAKIALAKASTKIGTAVNSGEGGFLPEERQEADHFILQFSKTHWAKDEDILKKADMIEIKLGQGGLAGLGAKITPEKLEGRARDIMGLEDGQDAIIHEHFFDNQTIADLKNLVSDLKQLTGGVPIGVKIAAGNRIEEDIDRIIEMKADVIAIDGAQGSTHDGPTIVQDDFGIPTLHAVVRAVNHLKLRAKKGEISLIVSGGLNAPGDFLKVLALGADAVYLGSSILFAMSHEQVLKPLPWEPPTQIVWYDGKYQDLFDIQKGSEAAYNFLHASTEEIKVALRAMGKRSLMELTLLDLSSFDEHTANMVKIPYTFNQQSP